MSGKLSRRSFMAKSAALGALGVLGACELGGSLGGGALARLEAHASAAIKEQTMPHISVKLFPGRSEEVKQRLADAIVRNVVDIIGSDEGSVSVAIEDVSPADWKEDVYDPDIRGKADHLYKKPGYSM